MGRITFLLQFALQQRLNKTELAKKGGPARNVNLGRRSRRARIISALCFYHQQSLSSKKQLTSREGR